MIQPSALGVFADRVRELGRLYAIDSFDAPEDICSFRRAAAWQRDVAGRVLFP